MLPASLQQCGEREDQRGSRMAKDGDGGGDTSTNMGRRVSEASIPIHFLDIYYRNLDLYSKSLKSSELLHGNLQIGSGQSSPVECGCNATHLEEKDVHTQGHRGLVGGQSKRTFPNHPKPGLQIGTHPPPSKSPEGPSTVSGDRHQLKLVEPGSTALPLSVKMKKSLVLHPGPCSMVQLPLPLKQ